MRGVAAGRGFWPVGSVSRIRIEVDDQHGGVSVIIDPPQPPAAKLARLLRVADGAIAELAATPGVHGREHARQILLCELTRIYADRLAYERVCQAHGLLPL